jgi:hypothetical protein
MTSPKQLLRRQISGLLIIAAIILILAIYRADLHALFPPGWWRF